MSARYVRANVALSCLHSFFDEGRRLEPNILPLSSQHIYSMPLLDDVTGDGFLDLVVGTLTGQVR